MTCEEIITRKVVIMEGSSWEEYRHSGWKSALLPRYPRYDRCSRGGPSTYVLHMLLHGGAYGTAQAGCTGREPRRPGM